MNLPFRTSMTFINPYKQSLLKIVMPLGVLLLTILTVTGLSAEPLMVTLVAEGAEKKVLIPSEEIDEGWRGQSDFNDSTWLSISGDPGGIGFDDSNEYNRYISLNVNNEMGGRTSCYVRALFNMDGALFAQLDYLALVVRYDDGFVAYINGEPVCQVNAPPNPGRRSAATQPHEAQGMETIEISKHLDKIVAGVNVLAIHALNVSGSSPDFLIMSKLVARKSYQDHFASTLPIVILQNQGQTLQSQNQAAYTAVSIIDNLGDNHLFDKPNDYQGRAILQTVDVLYFYNKGPMQMNIIDEAALPVDASLLGMAPGNEWILTAPYSDKTLLRDAVMSSLSQKMGKKGCNSRLVHLFKNGDYRGIYLLNENRNVHPNRLNLATLAPSDNSGDPLTGGYVLRLDHRRDDPGFDSAYKPFPAAQQPIHYQFSSPSAEAITPVQKAYINKFINDWEYKATTSMSSFLSVMDLSSFVDYFILNEIAKNVHAYRDLTLFVKDRDSINPRLRIEPVLDFQHTLGNVSYYDGDDVRNWQLEFLLNDSEARADSMLTPFWWISLINDAEFTGALYHRWQELRSGILAEASIAQLSDSLYQLIKKDQVLNFERWSVFDKEIWPSTLVFNTYNQEYDYMVVWLYDRLDWMDAAIQEFATAVHDENKKVAAVTDPVLFTNYPNPFNPSTTLHYRLNVPSQVIIRIFNNQGQLVSELQQGFQSPGSFSVTWEGKDSAGLAVPSGIYYSRLIAGGTVKTQKMVLMR